MIPPVARQRSHGAGFAFRRPDERITHRSPERRTIVAGSDARPPCHAALPMRRPRPASSLAVVLLGAATVAVAPQRAHAQSTSQCDQVVGNLVANCGFETGDFTGWTFVRGPSADLNTGIDKVDAHTGVYGAYFGAIQTSPTDHGDAIRQTLSTLPGQTYCITFYSADLNADGTPVLAPTPDNALRVLFGGAVVFEQPILNTAFSSFTVIGVATSATTVLEFDGFNNPAFDALDDVSVTATPEPGAWALLGTGLVTLGGVAVRRRRATMA